MDTRGYKCLTFLPLSYNGRGPAETCMQIVRHFPSQGLGSTVFVPRLTKAPPIGIGAHQGLPPPLRYLPWKYLREFAGAWTERSFRRAIMLADPGTTILTFWPDPSLNLLRFARERGFLIVREMINSACDMSRSILEAAYARQGLPPVHHVTQAKVARENEELGLYDFIVAPSSEVERSLIELGIATDRILRSSFGWHPDRFNESLPEPRTDDRLRFLFVGSIGVRKGLPELLQAWEQLALDAELVLVGNVEPGFVERFGEGLPANVRHVAFTPDVGRYYKGSDVFVFPSHEEGAPQVVYEAAGCGLPVITTPMGLARIIENERNGLLIPPGDVQALTAAMRRLVDDADLRRAMGAQAQRSAKLFTYQAVGQARARLLIRLLAERHRLVEQAAAVRA